MNGCSTSSPAAIRRFLSCWKAHIWLSATVSQAKNPMNRMAAARSSQPRGAASGGQALWIGEVKSQMISIWPGVMKVTLRIWKPTGPYCFWTWAHR